MSEAQAQHRARVDGTRRQVFLGQSSSESNDVAAATAYIMEESKEHEEDLIQEQSVEQFERSCTIYSSRSAYETIKALEALLRERFWLFQQSKKSPWKLKYTAVKSIKQSDGSVL